MSNSLVALQSQAPDVMGAFNQGAEAAQGRQMNSLRMQAVKQDMQNSELEQQRKQADYALQIIGSASMHALGGDINGKADPQRYEEALDMLHDVLGMDVEQYRGKSEFANTAARASMTTLQQIQAAKSEQDMELALKKFEADLATSNVPSGYEKVPGGLRAVPGGPADPNNPLNAKKAATPSLSATELKAVHSAEDELPNLDSSISQLERALELNDKAFSGFGASLRGGLGAKLPDGMVPDFVADPSGATATSEYEAIMTGEAATAMSAALKGATTDRELSIFIDIIGDVSKPPEVRRAAITRLLELARAKRETAARRIGELRGSATAAPAEGEASEISTKEEYDALPSGAEFIFNGEVGIKP